MSRPTLKLPPGKPLLYAVRHGQTAGNNKGVFRGPIDFPLDKTGVADATELGRLFKPVPVGLMVSSDMSRAIHTGMIIGDSKNLTPLPNPALRPWNVGYLAGQPKDSPESKAAIEYYQTHPEDRIPQGESLNEFRARVQPALEHLARMGQMMGLAPLVVAHSSVVHEVGNYFNGSHESTKVEPGGAAVVMQRPDGMIHAVAIHRADKGGTGLS